MITRRIRQERYRSKAKVLVKISRLLQSMKATVAIISKLKQPGVAGLEDGCMVFCDESPHATLTLQHGHFLITDCWIMGDSSASYIHMVHHLIEKCLIFNMTKEECMDALSKHADIKPVITSTVWNELEKENKEFFEAYAKSQSKGDRMPEEETSEMIHKMILDSSTGSDK